MAEVIRRNHLPGEARHRADEIHIHHRERKRSWWPFALLGLFALGLFALWSYSRNRSAALEAPTLAPIEHNAPAMAPPPPPAAERPASPIVPVPQAPDAEPETAAAPDSDAGAAPGGAAPAEDVACNQTITFDANETALGTEDLEAVSILAECVKQNPGTGITLEGRADPRGDAEYNAGLAQRRAQSMADALAAKGVPKDQLTTSIGAQLCSEATEECWQKNRSVVAGVPR